MNAGEANVERADLLTRTTLRMDSIPSADAIRQMIAALQRVPGVLLAEIAPGADRAVVAHDAAVPNAALLAAAARTGIRLTLVRDARAPEAKSVRSPFPLGMSIQHFAALWAAAIFGPLLLAAISPHLATNRLFFPVVLGSIWAFFVVRAIVGGRPKLP
jgi:hypothetical protein